MDRIENDYFAAETMDFQHEDHEELPFAILPEDKGLDSVETTLTESYSTSSSIPSISNSRSQSQSQSRLCTVFHDGSALSGSSSTSSQHAGMEASINSSSSNPSSFQGEQSSCSSTRREEQERNSTTLSQTAATMTSMVYDPSISLLQNKSQYLDAAVSLLDSNSFSLSSTPAGMGASNSLGKTSLMMHESVDAGHEKQHSLSLVNRLPVLEEEEQSLAASVAPTSTNTPHANTMASPPKIASKPTTAALNQNESEAFFPRQKIDAGSERISTWQYNNSMFCGSQTILPAAADPECRPFYRTEERRLASLAGATTNRTGDHSFQVSVDLTSNNNTCTVRDVLNIVGNPDLLRMWCDPIRGLVITKSSEGALNACIRNAPEANREYEGEWIEATTSQLVAPQHTSILYSASRSISEALGFPTYARITMFVERERQHVGLTLSPFPGRIEVSHSIQVLELQGGRIRIQDNVRLQHDTKDSESDEVRVCGIWDAIEKCLLPQTDDYMDQVLSSMVRLRFLVENGESSTHLSILEQLEQQSSTYCRSVFSSSTPLLGAMA